MACNDIHENVSENIVCEMASFCPGGDAGVKHFKYIFLIKQQKMTDKILWNFMIL